MKIKSQKLILNSKQIPNTKFQFSKQELKSKIKGQGIRSKIKSQKSKMKIKIQKLNQILNSKF